jgi:hypothetical protein
MFKTQTACNWPRVMGLAATSAHPRNRRPGMDEYIQACASCHGIAAQGNGPLAEFMTVTVPDLTRIAQGKRRRFPDASRLSRSSTEATLASVAMAVRCRSGAQRYVTEISPQTGEYGAELLVRGRILALATCIWNRSRSDTTPPTGQSGRGHITPASVGMIGASFRRSRHRALSRPSASRRVLRHPPRTAPSPGKNELDPPRAVLSTASSSASAARGRDRGRPRVIPWLATFSASSITSSARTRSGGRRPASSQRNRLSSTAKRRRLRSQVISDAGKTAS